MDFSREEFCFTPLAKKPRHSLTFSKHLMEQEDDHIVVILTNHELCSAMNGCIDCFDIKNQNFWIDWKWKEDPESIDSEDEDDDGKNAFRLSVRVADDKKPNQIILYTIYDSHVIYYYPEVEKLKYTNLHKSSVKPKSNRASIVLAVSFVDFGFKLNSWHLFPDFTGSIPVHEFVEKEGNQFYQETKFQPMEHWTLHWELSNTHVCDYRLKVDPQYFVELKFHMVFVLIYVQYEMENGHEGKGKTFEIGHRFQVLPEPKLETFRALYACVRFDRVQAIHFSFKIMIPKTIITNELRNIWQSNEGSYLYWIPEEVLDDIIVEFL
jgi:hypothetical protein